MHFSVRAPGRLARLSLALTVAGALALPLAAPAAAAEPDFPPNMSGYHNWTELVDEIKQAEQDHPDIVQLSSIGESYLGKKIWIAKISDNVAEDENEEEVLVDALHHAREHLTTEQALAMLRWLTDDYGTNERITDLVNSREIWIIFALNPDGMRHDLTGDPFLAWRKNRQRDAEGRAMFTDLNRNYGYRWGCCGGSSGNRASTTYRGPSAWSAPETRALRDFVNSRVVGGVQQIVTHVTLHTNGKLILWPYGYTKQDVPPDQTTLDHKVFVSLGHAMADLNGYTAEQSSDLYITDGDQIDWMYGVHRIFSYTFELFPPEKGSVFGDHYPDDSKIGPQTENNRTALLLLIERAGCPYAQLGEASTQKNCGPLFDDFEIVRGWTRDPDGTDTASSGRWVIANPEGTSSKSGTKQLGATKSGIKALVTGSSAGGGVNANDVDGGTTSIRSRRIKLPDDPADVGPLTFSYSWGTGSNATAADAFRVRVEAENGDRTTVWEVTGNGNQVNAAWRNASVDVDAYAGQRIRIVVEAVDDNGHSLVEAAIDDLRIRRP
jgi:hypothetical protein